MKREIIVTSDGSKTIYLPHWNEHYHSKHGAIQEAYHVFIKHGLELISKKEISILEMGFGTGLNAFITFLHSLEEEKMIYYTGVEAYPVKEKELINLNYIEQLNALNYRDVFSKLHASSWDKNHIISNSFSLLKRQLFFEDFKTVSAFDLIYYDAFGARVQPELWTETLFENMFLALKKKGVLVTYSAKGSVRRAMQTVGFTVERLPGPPGKREMLRAVKA